MKNQVIYANTGNLNLIRRCDLKGKERKIINCFKNCLFIMSKNVKGSFM